MAAAPVKSKPLHNFPFSFPKWGTNTTTATTNGREPDTDHNRATSSPRHTRVGSRSNRQHRPHRVSFAPLVSSPKPSVEAEGDATAAVTDDQEAEKHKKDETEEDEEVGEEEEEGTVQRPWNLRPRKGLMKHGVLTMEGNGGDYGSSYDAKLRGSSTEPKSMRLRGLAAESSGVVAEKKKEKPRFWISLSKDEIEEDIFILTGNRPARRPKKRPKNVQKQLDNLFPGLWLVGTTADSYKVDDTPAKI